MNDHSRPAVHTLAVKDLVLQTCQAGDLYPDTGIGRTTAEEGIRAQQRLQRLEAEGYQSEYSLARHVVVAGVAIVLKGRADGIREHPERFIVDEIKASRAQPLQLAQQQGHLHWAQLRTYAALLALENPRVHHFELRLRYVHPDSLVEHCQEQACTRDQLLTFFADCLQRFGRRLAAELRRRAARNRALATLAFPLSQFRTNQRALAGRVYRALCSRESLLLEASTGIGKTLGILYPALRAFARSGNNRYLYLTARKTGALAATRALTQLSTTGAPLVWITLTSKQQLCQQNGEPCNPRTCQNALGYYDRVEAALAQLLPYQQLHRKRIEQVAQQHQVCPFELSLDAALWCDVIVGDYNYVFDPDVRLQRFANGSDSTLLIDEAHQLAPRTASMLAATLDQQLLHSARRSAGSGALRKRLDSVNRAMNQINREHAGPSLPDTSALNRAIERLLAEAAILDWHNELSPELVQWLWDSQRWLRRQSLTESLPRLLQRQQTSPKLQLQLACLDPAAYLESIFARFGGDVRFSGTLRPSSLYQRLHGRRAAAAAHIASPYQQHQLLTCVVTNVPTYYRQRQQSLPDLVRLILSVVEQRRGTYLIALPSFEYLEQLRSALSEQSTHQVLAQSRDMSDAQRAAFLEDLRNAAKATLALVVLGGIFAESVDFTGIRLCGVVCVGIGLAPPSTLNSAREQHHQQAGEDGALIAFTQPAMVKVVQMAGRLLRGPQDRGVLLLIDQRFTNCQYQQFFPDHWQPQRLRWQQVPGALAKFWPGD